MTGFSGIDFIAKRVAKRTGVTLTELRGPRHFRSTSRVRQFAMWLAREMTGASFPELGHYFKRDHSTVQYACRQVEHRLAEKDRATVRLLEVM
jgi:chromosomal replication initiator protein